MEKSQTRRCYYQSRSERRGYGQLDEEPRLEQPPSNGPRADKPSLDQAQSSKPQPESPRLHNPQPIPSQPNKARAKKTPFEGCPCRGAKYSNSGSKRLDDLQPAEVKEVIKIIRSVSCTGEGKNFCMPASKLWAEHAESSAKPVPNGIDLEVMEHH